MKPGTFNEYEKKLLYRPSVIGDYCAVCGQPADNNHHVIIKGMGGRKKYERAIPTIKLCGIGASSGCHGLAHEYKLHFRWREGWEYLLLNDGADYGVALGMENWRKL